MLIRQLNLFTANLKQQLHFYGNILQIPIAFDGGTYFELSVGNSLLRFTYRPVASAGHFAFNIPSNKGKEALSWLRPRVNILGFEGHDLIDFPDWNAESVYFYDAGKNIVELIARKNLRFNNNEPFDAQQFMNISEIGVATDNIENTYGQLNAVKSLPIYSGDFDRFCAVGSEEGLFILADRVKKHWFPTGDTICLTDFELQGDYNIAYRNGQVLPLY
jgi:hypothetical protein